MLRDLIIQPYKVGGGNTILHIRKLNLRDAK